MHIGAGRGLRSSDQHIGDSAYRGYNYLLFLELRHGGAEGTTIHH